MFFIRPPCAVRTTKSGILFSIPLFFLRRVCYNGASIMKKVHSAGSRSVTFVHFCHHTPQGDVETNTLASVMADSESHPARGHRRPPRFTAQFCAAKRGGCFFVKFWAVPDFFRNFSNCGSFCSFCIRIWTVFHWKFAQKSGRNFSVSGVFLCRIPCYNGSKSFHGGQQLRLREFLPL